MAVFKKGWRRKSELWYEAATPHGRITERNEHRGINVNDVGDDLETRRYDGRGEGRVSVETELSPYTQGLQACIPL